MVLAYVLNDGFKVKMSEALTESGTIAPKTKRSWCHDQECHI